MTKNSAIDLDLDNLKWDAVPLSRRRYDVTTWDPDKQAFTPHAGVRRGQYTLFGLRRAIRKLQYCGYGRRRDEPSVKVERTK